MYQKTETPALALPTTQTGQQAETVKTSDVRPAPTTQQVAAMADRMDRWWYERRDYFLS